MVCTDEKLSTFINGITILITFTIFLKKVLNLVSSKPNYVKFVFSIMQHTPLNKIQLTKNFSQHFNMTRISSV